MNLLEKFCKEPSNTNFKSLPEILQRILNTIAEYSIENSLGDVERSIKIHKIFTASKLSEESRRSIKAIFRCLLLLKTPQFLQISEHSRLYPYIKIVTNADKFTISFSTELEDMYKIVSKSSDSIAKELLMYEDNTKQFLIDEFVVKKLHAHKITIYFSDENKKVFYDSEYGIVWSEQDYYNCVKNMNKMSKNPKNIKNVKKL